MVIEHLKKVFEDLMMVRKHSDLAELHLQEAEKQKLMAAWKLHSPLALVAGHR